MNAAKNVRFTVGIDEQVWYLDELLDVFEKGLPESIHLKGFRMAVSSVKSFT